MDKIVEAGKVCAGSVNSRQKRAVLYTAALMCPDSGTTTA
jgi:hypothetical protein